MSTAEWIDRGFAVRLGALLQQTRRARGQTRGALARQGCLTRRQLKEVELGMAPLDDELIGEVAALYGADLGELSGLADTRPTIEIDIAGSLRVGSAQRTFDPLDDASLLTAYLSAVRQVRRQEREPVIALRRDDIEVLAGFLCLPGEQVVDQLATLMGVTQRRRRSMVAMFAAGASVIGLATATATATVALGAPYGPTLDSSFAAVTLMPATSGAPERTALLTEPAVAGPERIEPLSFPQPLPPPPPTAVPHQVDLPLPAPSPTRDDPAPPEVEAEPGRVVAVDLPPVPPVPGFEAEPGRVVAVGLPPVPPGAEVGPGVDPSVEDLGP